MATQLLFAGNLVGLISMYARIINFVATFVCKSINSGFRLPWFSVKDENLRSRGKKIERSITLDTNKRWVDFPAKTVSKFLSSTEHAHS